MIFDMIYILLFKVFSNKLLFCCKLIVHLSLCLFFVNEMVLIKMVGRREAKRSHCQIRTMRKCLWVIFGGL